MSTNSARLTLVPSAERRRAAAIQSIGKRIEGIGFDVRTGVAKLGNRDAYVELRNLKDLLEQEIGRIEQLGDEFRELAEAKTEDE